MTVNKSAETQFAVRGEICFDTALLTKALRYHLRDAGLPENQILQSLKGRTVAFSVPKQTWALLDDEQRLSWLLEACRARSRKGIPLFQGFYERLNGSYHPEQS